MTTLDVVSTEILASFTASSVAPVSHEGTKIGDEAESSVLATRHPGFRGKLLVEMFVQLKAAFEIYANIGGAFIFALVLDIGTWAYKMACVTFFNPDYTKLVFSSTLTVTQGLIAMLVLLMVAEVGHQMFVQVSAFNAMVSRT